MSIYSFDSSDSRYMFTVATDTTGKFLESVCIAPHSELPEYMTERMPMLEMWDAHTLFRPMINKCVVFDGVTTTEELQAAIPVNADDITTTEFWAGLAAARELAAHLTEKFSAPEEEEAVLSFDDEDELPEFPTELTPHAYMVGCDLRTGKWGFWQILKVNPKTVKVAQCLTRIDNNGLMIPGCLNDFHLSKLVKRVEGANHIARDKYLALGMWTGTPMQFDAPTMTESEYFAHV